VGVERKKEKKKTKIGNLSRLKHFFLKDLQKERKVQELKNVSLFLTFHGVFDIETVAKGGGRTSARRGVAFAVSRENETKKKNPITAFAESSAPEKSHKCWQRQVKPHLHTCWEGERKLLCLGRLDLGGGELVFCCFVEACNF
jgi:hypothetical protein